MLFLLGGWVGRLVTLGEPSWVGGLGGAKIRAGPFGLGDSTATVS